MSDTKPAQEQSIDIVEELDEGVRIPDDIRKIYNKDWFSVYSRDQPDTEWIRTDQSNVMSLGEEAR